jgi:hypothetical protein
MSENDEQTNESENNNNTEKEIENINNIIDQYFPKKKIDP